MGKKIFWALIFLLYSFSFWLFVTPDLYYFSYSLNNNGSIWKDVWKVVILTWKVYKYDWKWPINIFIEKSDWIIWPFVWYFYEQTSRPYNSYMYLWHPFLNWLKTYDWYAMIDWHKFWWGCSDWEYWYRRW